jgi:hypothetical protein
MVARKTAAKKTAASKRAAAAPVEEVEETTRRGRTPDMGKYELFAEWAAEEHDFEVDPEQAMFVMTHYKDFQVSDVNKQYNEDKRAAAEQAKAERASRRAERESASDDEDVEKPVRRTAKKASAATASAPAKKAAAAKKAPAKKATARRRPAAAQEAF